jgi:uncharacterized cupredoxin-like copper-binding protein
MTRPTPVLLAAALVSIAIPACSREDRQGAEAVHHVTVTLNEFRFETSDSVFVAGVPYRFTLVNAGALPHEWAVVPRGAPDERDLLFEVEEEELPPGATVTREFTFPEAGEFDFACFMPGHYEGGMVLPVRVRAAE